MTRCRVSWLMMLMLGSALPPSLGYSQNPPNQALILELLQRVERLEAEVRQIRGELELQRYQFERLQSERAAEYPASLPKAMAPAASPVQPTASAPPPPPLEQTPAAATSPSVPQAEGGVEQMDFNAALAEWREGRYSTAIIAWQRFLNAHPNSKLAGDAQYWLGEAYYVSRDYQAAKEAFINLGLNDPQSVRLPDALLKLGYIYGELGDITRAREVLQKLMQVYPNTQAANLAERRLQSLR
jgi:tol-pal system protein YbgF